jgi:hypothetical protein
MVVRSKNIRLSENVACIEETNYVTAFKLETLKGADYMLKRMPSWEY